jgi:enoyl-CoA hydratase/carnithine racemase
MKNFDTVTAVVTDNIGRLVLARPEVLNALSPHCLEEIAEATYYLADQGCPVIVVSGEGRSFCAGFDLGSFGDATVDGVGTAKAGNEMASALEEVDAITIASIQGHCVGGGVVLAAGCDLRVATSTAQFAIPEVDLGIPLAWGGIPRLVRAIGPSATIDIVATCRRFDAAEALTLGLVNRVVDESELSSTVDTLATSLAGKTASVLATTKRQVNEAAEALVSTDRAWRDAVMLVHAQRNPDGRAAAERYLRARE